jgi:UMF1 family MFS transporter
MSTIIKDDPKIIKAWTFYDWANSVFPLVITSAIFPNFYEYQTSHIDGKDVGDVVSLFGLQFHNQDIYSYVYSFALFIVVLTAPILSGIADYYGNKKNYLKFFCYLGSISCMCLYFFDRAHLGLSFIPFVTATIGFWGSLVFYNSYLPEIASEKNQDTVSARGFALGYFGSSLLLILCLVGIIVFKYDPETGTGFFKVKYAFLLTGLWWMGFAQYTFKKLPGRIHKARGSESNLISKGFNELRSVWKELKKHKELKKFLSSYFFYNMGVQTIMVVAVLFARKEITWPDEKTKTNSLIVSILLIQFLGVAGSFLFAWISRKIGNIKGLMIAILFWVFICTFTFAIARLPIHFYIVAACVGLVMGGVQSLSRSTYSKLLPERDDHTSYFSFYDVMEKMGMILGTVSFGVISQITGGMRNSVLALILFFVIGLILLFNLNRYKKL